MKIGSRRFAVLLLNAAGKSRTAELSSEDELVEFLTATYRTEAPLSFKYLDGSPVETKVMDQIYTRVFETTKQ
jgi:hypothetical protein